MKSILKTVEKLQLVGLSLRELAFNVMRNRSQRSPYPAVVLVRDRQRIEMGMVGGAHQIEGRGRIRKLNR
jgi:hypothetical protein